MLLDGRRCDCHEWDESHRLADQTDKHTGKRVNCTLKRTMPFRAIKCVRPSGPTMEHKHWMQWRSKRGASARVFVQNIWTIVIKINDRAQMRSQRPNMLRNASSIDVGCRSQKYIRQWMSLERSNTLQTINATIEVVNGPSTDGHLSKIARDVHCYAFWYLIEFLFVLSVRVEQDVWPA